MTTLGFFARNNRDSIFRMEEIFTDSDKYVYFIEDEKTNEWLTKDSEWTKDPLNAMKFKSDMAARTYAVSLRTAVRWVITEHEFPTHSHPNR